MSSSSNTNLPCTSTYKFGCHDCTYQSKYGNRLKKHFKKYGHNRAEFVSPSVGLDSSESHGEEDPKSQDDDDDFVPLDYSQSQSSFDKSDDSTSVEDTHSQLTNLKIAALEANLQTLEAKNQMFEAKLENQALKAKMRDKSMERKLHDNQQKIDEFTQKLASLEQKHQLEILELTAKTQALMEGNETFGNNLKATKDATEMAKIRVEETMRKWKQRQIQEFDKETPILKEEEKKQKIHVNDLMQLEKLLKTKKIRNPQNNRWSIANMKSEISPDGLTAENDIANKWVNVYAQKGFVISFDKNCRRKHGITYYFEVTKKLTNYKNWGLFVGLSDGSIPDGSHVGYSPNSFAIRDSSCTDECWLSGPKNMHCFELPDGTIKPKLNYEKEVFGCGLMMEAKNKFSIFFTLNGTLMGKQIPISTTVDCLYPTVSMWIQVAVQANFGNDLANNPFKFNIGKMYEKKLRMKN